MTIGKRISELRKAHGYSQEYVAERLDVSRQAVSKWENDASAPDTYNLIALAELFEVSVEYLAIGNRPEQTQATEAEQGGKQPMRQESITPQRVVGFILLGVGLLALILGILLSEFLLVALSVYLLVGSVLCLAVRRSLGMVASWTYLALTFFGISILSRKSLFCILNLPSYRDGLTLWHVFSFAFWIWLAVTAGFTLGWVRKKKKNRE